MLSRIFKITLLVLILSSCSWKDVIDLISPSSGGIDTEIVVGDKNQAITTEIGKQEQKAETITNTSIDNAPIWLIVFGVVGWILPTPVSMVKSWRNRHG